jgi:MoaA/NifB/PqqE/SkfB family radical SAM enzyme
MTATSEIAVTTSGIVARRDRGLGLVAFSPYTGLVYAIRSNDIEPVLSWLEGEADVPGPAYATSLGAGWFVPMSQSKQPERQLLPAPDEWLSSAPAADRPIVINWLITGSCQMGCKYCYAEDLMATAVEPTLQQLEATAERILGLSPVAVVLTGGDPLTSPSFNGLLARLSGRVGLIVDTNGLAIRTEHMPFFVDNRVVARVSLDSERPSENEKFRCLRGRSGDGESGPTEAAVSAITSLLDWGVTTVVQTVATKYSASDLVSLGDKLYRMGVRSWRIHRVADSQVSNKGYERARLSNKAFEHGVSRVRRSLRCDWGPDFSIMFEGNEQRNSVVLVSPDGRFLTETQPIRGARTDRGRGQNKVVIDPDRPRRPRPAAIRREVNMWAHASRYLNLSVD